MSLRWCCFRLRPVRNSLAQRRYSRSMSSACLFMYAAYLTSTNFIIIGTKECACAHQNSSFCTEKKPDALDPVVTAALVTLGLVVPDGAAKLANAATLEIHSIVDLSLPSMAHLLSVFTHRFGHHVRGRLPLVLSGARVLVRLPRSSLVLFRSVPPLWGH